MISKIITKEEALRNRVYKFFFENKAKGKIYTVNHFMAEKVPRRTIYSILQRSEHSPVQRKSGSGRKAKKMNKRQVNKLKKAFNHNDKLSLRQAGKKFAVSHQMISKVLKKHRIEVRHKKIYQKELNRKNK